MRKIKFRAWTGEQMLYPPDGFLFEATVVATNYPGGITLNTFGRKQMELMQFTSIKDKNGRDVYEGDILQDTLTRRVFEVKFGFCKKYAFTGFYCETADGYQASLNVDDDTDINSQIQVAGNIFEAPELINTPA
jgi:uncharacterized phage protein (TIGR01671 family)